MTDFACKHATESDEACVSCERPVCDDCSANGADLTGVPEGLWCDECLDDYWRGQAEPVQY